MVARSQSKKERAIRKVHQNRSQKDKMISKNVGNTTNEGILRKFVERGNNERMNPLRKHIWLIQIHLLLMKFYICL